MEHLRGDVLDVLRTHWDGRAQQYDGEAGHGLRTHEQREAWLQLLRPIAGSPPKRIIDIGCGTGFLALCCAELGHTVTGIDFSPQMLAVAREKAEQASLPVQFRLGDAMRLPDPDETYDVALSRHVLWTMPDPAAAIAGWLRVLRPGGTIAIVEGKWADNSILARENSTPARKVGNAVFEGLLAFYAFLRRRTSSTLLVRRYRRVHAQLPFSGGAPQERLVDLLHAHGVRNITAAPLMDARYWAEEPRFPRYIVTGER